MVRLAMETVSARKRIYYRGALGGVNIEWNVVSLIRLLSPNRDQEKDIFECIVLVLCVRNPLSFPVQLLSGASIQSFLFIISCKNKSSGANFQS